MRDVVSRYGVPVVIHSDKGANFKSNVMKQLCQLLGMKKTRTTAYHPQSDGLVERMNKTLMEAISKYVSNNQHDWDLWLPLVLFDCRILKRASTEEKPHRLIFGKKVRLPIDVELQSSLPQHQPTTDFNQTVEKQLQMTRVFQQ